MKRSFKTKSPILTTVVTKHLFNDDLDFLIHLKNLLAGSLLFLCYIFYVPSEKLAFNKKKQYKLVTFNAPSS